MYETQKPRKCAILLLSEIFSKIENMQVSVDAMKAEGFLPKPENKKREDEG
jgi:hypothetical protein